MILVAPDVYFPGFGKCEIWATGRKGTRSPTTFYVKHHGRLKSPFERRVRGWPNIPTEWVFRFFFREYYKNDPVNRLIAEFNPLLEELKFKGSEIPWCAMSVASALPIAYWRKK